MIDNVVDRPEFWQRAAVFSATSHAVCQIKFLVIFTPATPACNDTINRISVQQNVSAVIDIGGPQNVSGQVNSRAVSAVVYRA